VKAEAKANPRAVVVRAGQERPVVTFGLIGICTVLWLLQLVSSSITDGFFFAPALGEGEPWRFLTAAFLHDPSSPMHLLFNMYALWLTGQYLEPVLGRVRFLALYLVSALGGSVGYEVLTAYPSLTRGWLQGTVGASGAVFGLFLAVVVLNLKLKRDITSMLVVIAINAVLSIVIAGIAWQAHLGGAVTGAACAAVLLQNDKRLQWAGLGVVAALLVGIGWAVLGAGPQF
jgi:membrane associated rhomboid family serine protease